MKPGLQSLFRTLQCFGNSNRPTPAFLPGGLYWHHGREWGNLRCDVLLANGAKFFGPSTPPRKWGALGNLAIKGPGWPFDFIEAAGCYQQRRDLARSAPRVRLGWRRTFVASLHHTHPQCNEMQRNATKCNEMQRNGNLFRCPFQRHGPTKRCARADASRRRNVRQPTLTGSAEAATARLTQSGEADATPCRPRRAVRSMSLVGAIRAHRP